MKMKVIELLLIGFLGTNAFGQGTILWNESVNGPLSNDGSNPTSLSPLQPGINSVIGTTEVVPAGTVWTIYPDFFTITIPAGWVVTAVNLQVNEPNVWTWIGDTSYANQLAFVTNPSSGDLLAQWGLTSLGSGVYGIDIENHDFQSVTSIASYELDFVLQAVPEPSAFSLWLVGASCFVGLHCWRKFRLKAR